MVNIGIEGMMILGTFGAGYAGYQWGPWAGVFFGIVCGLLGGLLLGLATITVGVDHIIAGRRHQHPGAGPGAVPVTVGVHRRSRWGTTTVAAGQ